MQNLLNTITTIVCSEVKFVKEFCMWIQLYTHKDEISTTSTRVWFLF